VEVKQRNKEIAKFIFSTLDAVNGEDGSVSVSPNETGAGMKYTGETNFTIPGITLKLVSERVLTTAGHFKLENYFSRNSKYLCHIFL